MAYWFSRDCRVGEQLPFHFTATKFFPKSSGEMSIFGWLARLTNEG